MTEQVIPKPGSRWYYRKGGGTENNPVVVVKNVIVQWYYEGSGDLSRSYSGDLKRFGTDLTESFYSFTPAPNKVEAGQTYTNGRNGTFVVLEVLYGKAYGRALSLEGHWFACHHFVTTLQNGKWELVTHEDDPF